MNETSGPVRRWMKRLALATTLLVAGCTQTTGTAGTEICSLWRPVSWSQKDTPQTVADVKVNNARRAGYCGGR